MNPVKQNVIEYCLSKPYTSEDMPFDDRVWTAKVFGKIFILFDIVSEENRFNLKCDPDKALELRAEYPEHVLPGYHMNKKHWNTVVYDNEEIRYNDLKSWIDHSYDLVFKSLPKKYQNL